MKEMIARVSSEVIFVPSLGTIARDLIFSLGDFRQRYDGATPGNPGNIAPDYKTLKPTISYEIYDSETGNPVDSSTFNVSWIFNGKVLQFDSVTGECTGEVNNDQTQGIDFKGLFKYIKPSSSVDTHKLQILDNLVSVAGASCMLTATAVITGTSGQTTNVSSSLRYGIVQATSNDYSLTIMPVGPGSINFADPSVHSDADKRWGYIDLKAVYSQGVTDIPNPTLNWEYYDGSAFVAASTTVGDTTKPFVNADGTLRVKCTDVTSTLLVKCTATCNAAGDGRASDIHVVLDHSDPLNIIPNCTPADRILEEGSTVDCVAYEPILSATDDKGDEIASWNGAFEIAVFGEAGEQIANPVKITKGGKFELYKGAFANGHTQLNVLISTTSDTTGAVPLATCGK